MLVNLNDVLLPAQKGGYGVGLFNTINAELAAGVFAAAEAMRSPVIVGTAEVLCPLEVLKSFPICSYPWQSGQAFLWCFILTTAPP